MGLLHERQVAQKHNVQILRQAQDDKTAVRCHPEPVEGSVHFVWQYQNGYSMYRPFIALVCAIRFYATASFGRSMPLKRSLRSLGKAWGFRAAA